MQLFEQNTTTRIENVSYHLSGDVTFNQMRWAVKELQTFLYIMHLLKITLGENELCSILNDFGYVYGVNKTSDDVVSLQRKYFSEIFENYIFKKIKLEGVDANKVGASFFDVHLASRFHEFKPQKVETTGSVTYLISIVEIMAIVGLQDYGMAKDLLFWFSAYLKGRIDGVCNYNKKLHSMVEDNRSVNGIPFTQADWLAIIAYDKVKIKVRNDEVVIDLQRRSGK